MNPHSVYRSVNSEISVSQPLPKFTLLWKVIKHTRLGNLSLRHFSNLGHHRSLREKELLIRKLEQYRGGQDDDGAGHDHDGDADEATCKSFY